MSVSPRQYLLDRFRADAVALRERAAVLAKGPKQPGPDAATSTRMAAACDAVCAMLEAIPESDDVVAMLDALTALVPLLEQHATKAASSPPLRAVYVGAATRVKEIEAAERRAAQPTTDSHDAAPDDDSLDDDTLDDDALDDADLDDDDLHDEDRSEDDAR